MDRHNVMNIVIKRMTALLLMLVMVFASAGVMSGSSLAYTAQEGILYGTEDLEHELLTGMLIDPVGVQGFDGDYRITSYDEAIEIIVQFVTPPSVALKQMQEKSIQTGFSTMSMSFEGQALSAHDAFLQQLAEISTILDSDEINGVGENDDDFSINGFFNNDSGNDISTSTQFEITSAYHELFNGVIMRVPGGMVDSIASLPEVFGVFPNVTYYLFNQSETVEANALFQSQSFINSNLLLEARNLLNTNNINNTMNITGRGIRVAVLDTGIQSDHPEFLSYRDSTGRIRGWNFGVGNSPGHYHGTAVSGCVIAIAPGVELWNYRVAISPGSGQPAISGGTFLGALTQAYNDNINIVNMSFGSPVNTPYDPMITAVNNIIMAGTIVVVAAGNSGPNVSTVNVPGTSSLAITVGAGTAGGTPPLSSPDNVAGFSSRGPVAQTNHIKPDIIAPGDKLLTTTLGSSYAYVSGTSFSAPIISGVAALLLEAFPGSSPHEIKARMMNTARNLNENNQLFAVGAGFVQPLAALTSGIVVTVDQTVPVGQNPLAPFEMQKMASLSYGVIRSNSSRTNPLNIRNTGATTRTFTISPSFISNPNNAGSFNLNNSSVTVGPGNTGTINVTFNSGNFLNGSIQGHLIISEGASTIARIPFAAFPGTDIYVTNVISPAGAAISGDNITVSMSPSIGVINQPVSITVNQGSTWALYKDAACTIMIADNIMRLFVGTNTAYIKVTAQNGATRVYTLTITRQTPSVPVFPDVPQNSWFVDYVSWAQVNGIIQGSNGRFLPNNNMIRADFVLVLYRLEGLPPTGPVIGYTDVRNSHYAYDAIIWAQNMGIATGSGGRFRPGDSMTREEMVTILYRFTNLKNGDTSSNPNAFNTFPDRGRVSSFATEPMHWATTHRVITGSNGQLLPRNNATRAEVVAVLQRYVTAFG